MMMLEDDDDDEICCGGGGGGGGRGGGGGKKRRLGLEQVRALERCFEVENKLEPERKARLAQELGLQPRQVAVWFQNRRARCKTKQLERDFNTLKSRYEALRLDFDSLRCDHNSLLSQIAGLKSRLGPTAAADNDDDQILLVAVKQEEEKPAVLLGSSDSGSSAVLTDDSSPLISSAAARGGAQSWGWREAEGGIVYEAQKLFEMEQCSAALFSDEHAPNLAWLSADLAGGDAAGW